MAVKVGGRRRRDKSGVERRRSTALHLILILTPDHCPHPSHLRPQHSPPCSPPPISSACTAASPIAPQRFALPSLLLPARLPPATSAQPTAAQHSPTHPPSTSTAAAYPQSSALAATPSTPLSPPVLCRCRPILLPLAPPVVACVVARLWGDGRPPPSAAAQPSSFLVPRKTFSHQFAALYFVRLHTLRPACQATATRALEGEGGGGAAFIGGSPRSPPPVVCRRLLDVQAGVRCVLTGTLYKEQRLKPSILQDYSEQKKGKKPPTAQETASQMQREAEGDGERDMGGGGGGPREDGGGEASHVGRWVSDDDSAVLEDESGRIGLVRGGGVDGVEDAGPYSSFLLHRFCTGVVMAVLGRQEEKGRFRVERVFVPGMAPQAPSPFPSGPPSSPTPPRLVLLVSGLSFGCPAVDPLPLQLLQDFATGFVGGRKDVERVSLLEGVIVAGNSLHRFPKRRSKDGLKEEYDMADYVAPGRELDCLLTRLSAVVPSVYLLPGPADPANFTLPQQPLHSCLSPSAATFESFHSITNPALIPFASSSPSLSPFTFLVSSGQNVSDALSNVSGLSAVKLLSALLSWRHLCPSAPDTLPCYPHQTEDPFIVQHTPHVLVAGNQTSYDSALVKGEDGQMCRVVSLPSFAHSGTAAVVDLSSPTLHCEPLQFSVQTRRRSHGKSPH